MNKKNSKLPPALFLMGPTASGKTNLAVDLTDVFPMDIISVDSALIYKGMDVGTAKPDASVLAKAPHRLISFLDPSQAYSVAEFREDALREMAEITARGRIPLLVGGTMLYFKVLQQGMAKLPPANQSVREKILLEAKENGWPQLHKRLASVDPKAALRIKTTDTQRLQRALEVYETTGRSLSSWHDEQEFQPFPYRLTNLAVSPQDRSVLHQRIELRFHQMLKDDFEQEVRLLHQRKDLNSSLPSIRAVGYRQIWSLLDGKLTQDEMINKGIAATRQLAKRQLTWLRNWHDVNWLDSLSLDLRSDALKVIGHHLEY